MDPRPSEHLALTGSARVDRSDHPHRGSSWPEQLLRERWRHGRRIHGEQRRAAGDAAGAVSDEDAIALAALSNGRVSHGQARASGPPATGLKVTPASRLACHWYDSVVPAALTSKVAVAGALMVWSAGCMVIARGTTTGVTVRSAALRVWMAQVPCFLESAICDGNPPPRGRNSPKREQALLLRRLCHAVGFSCCFTFTPVRKRFAIGSTGSGTAQPVRFAILTGLELEGGFNECDTCLERIV